MATSAEKTIQDLTVRDLLDAGLHFGHQTKRWNPKMKRYIFDKRNGIHIIDLSKSMVLLKEALKFIYEVVAGGKTVLLVGTKKQAQEAIKETAVSCGQHYVTHRWLGGTLTNLSTIRRSVARFKTLETMENEKILDTLYKKEASVLRHEMEKLRRNLCGITAMDDLPGAMFVVDVTREAIAVKEANRLKIPVVAIVDTNCDPDPVNYPIPGNDDSLRSVTLICQLLKETFVKANEAYGKVAAEKARQIEIKKAEAAARGETYVPPSEAPKTRPARERKPRTNRGDSRRPGGTGGRRGTGHGGTGRKTSKAAPAAAKPAAPAETPKAAPAAEEPKAPETPKADSTTAKTE